MSNVSKIVKMLSAMGRNFYHFTDARNLPSIRQHGLLSIRSLTAMGLSANPGGNELSLSLDRKNGMDDYVHLCFFDEHGMEYKAKQDGRICESRFLRIAPTVAEIPGVLITDRVANRKDAQPVPIEEKIHKLDLEVIYKWTEWTDPAIQARLRKAKCFEILIPKAVPIELIGNLD